MSRPDLVLLHGWGLGPQVWSALTPHLPAALRVRTPALPGHGGAPARDTTLEAWSDALLPELPDGAVVCGWSLGGLIALDLARRYPRKVARLVLIGTSPCFVTRPENTAAPWPHGLAASTVAGFIDVFAHDSAATLRRFVALQALGDARRRTVANTLNAALADIEQCDPAALGAGLELLADSDRRAALDDVRQPVQLIHGAGDALMPVAAAEWLATRLPDARLARFDDCGHAPFLSRPEDCAALIEDVVRG
ncbi:alpha/beta fold hydrolase [Aromatoleum anaerobium]|uniref:Pimeloyl-[acyl-carrier protein] methyl ester esterase n=1 Tax=Aromatoleum anaerobium TaxID=182180 RepID=A0ABX1PPU0_9RHOO|nr:alpha/beta fold hydrolase [Aromatoleum anaerobium]MCK0505813.1 alpha/beta fold hydrolase [Aromatoleum anaerobium]